MPFISIFNDVLGPVMRGPSSSHTAGSYRIGKMARSLLGEDPASAVFLFDPEGSYAKTFRQQGADLGLAAGLMGWPITDERFPHALESASQAGLSCAFEIGPIPGADHPNTVLVELTGEHGGRLRTVAQSIGGGLVVFRQVEDWEVELTGKTHVLLVECDEEAVPGVEGLVTRGEAFESLSVKPGRRGGTALVHHSGPSAVGGEVLRRVRSLSGVLRVWTAPPLFYVQRGEPLFSSAEEVAGRAKSRGTGLGRAALEYEAALLGFSEREAKEEMLRRWDFMTAAVSRGLEERDLKMKLLQPSARSIFEAEAAGNLALGGPGIRAAARAMAVVHVANSGGVICAAPTGASSGVIPGVLATLVETKRLTAERVTLALFGAAAVGLVIARRATFAAEVAGCQVEIGAAGAMAAAAAVEAMGGSADKALDAAAVSLQNSMGSVCDLVQGLCEIPCHTRNAAAAAGALVCADLILGGYTNPIPLDATVDAVFAVGKMLPGELRCTSLGGLAVTPPALALRNPE